MGDLVCMNKRDETDLIKDTADHDTVSDSNRETGGPYSQAVVPTIDIYAAKVLFNLTQKMVETAVDRRVSLLEKSIEERDKEMMRTIRKMQARMVMQHNKVQLPWWRRLFNREK